MRKLTILIVALILAFPVTAQAKPKYDWVYIPSVGISERVQFADYGMDTQVICDKKDRAVAYRYRGSIGIADHNYQGFRNLPRVKVRDKARVTLFGKTKTYICIKVFNGYNRSAYLTDRNNKIVELKKGEIQMYTCTAKSSTRKIIITIWRELK